MLLLDLVSCMLVASQSGLPMQEVGPSVALERLWALTTAGGPAGAVVTVQGGPPWRAEPLAPTDGGRLLRRFGRALFAVNGAAVTIQRIPLGGGAVQDYHLGAGSEPQDIHVRVTSTQLAPLAYVTRRNDPSPAQTW